MRLEIEQRPVRGAVVLDCAGRIVLGPEVEKLQAAVQALVADRCDVVINLEKVTHIDSNGLGALLRLANSSRAAGASLVFCNPTPHVQNLFHMTRLYTALAIHESEKAALASRGAAPPGAAPAAAGRKVLCVEPSVEMLVYFTGVLKTAGFEIRSTRHYPDAIVLWKAERPDVVLFGPGACSAAPSDAEREFRRLTAEARCVELEKDFAAGEAGASSARLLQRMEQLLS